MPLSKPLEAPNRLDRITQNTHWYFEWMNPDAAHLHGIERVVAFQKTRYQLIEIYQTRLFGKFLVLDGDPQSSEHDEDIYHEALVHPALVTHPDARQILILGGGEGATLREVLRHPHVEQAVMVDIDDEVVRICQKELGSYSKGAFDDSRTHLIIDDANKYIKETPKLFDVIISDLTLPYEDTPAEDLMNEEFFRSIKKKMKPNGLFAMQASRTERGMSELYIQYIQMVKKLWKIVRPYRSFIPSFYSEWGFIVASDELDPLKVSRETVDQKLSFFASQLRYYDGTLHPALFVLPKELRKHT